jgi:hypothetical protein
LRFGDEGSAVVPAGAHPRLQDVAVDLEDAAVARLDRDVALHVERRRRRAQLEVASLDDGLLVLAFALRLLPRLAAVARDDRADDRLRRREARGDAALGLAQPSLALGDDAAHRLQGEHEGDQDGDHCDRFGEERETTRCHEVVPFSTSCTANRGRRRQDRRAQRRECEGDAAPRPGR